MAIASVNGNAQEGELTHVLGGMRRLAALADAVEDADAVFCGLARELIATLGAEEVHVHHLNPPGEDELVVVYMLEGDGQLSYLLPQQERPPGVNWVASSASSFLAVGPRELTASVPRLSITAPPRAEAAGCALLAPLTSGGRVEAVVVLVRRESEPFQASSVEEAATLVQQAATVLALVRARAEAGTDSVAGCLNHRAMRRRLHEEIGRVQRSGGRLSCVIVDLDDFKLVNDRYGHQAGDSILRQVAQALTGEFRAFDRVARYGGDEFVVILPNAELDSAVAAAGRALARMRRVLFPDGSRGVSASMGVAEWRAPMTEAELLEVCDVALLQGKRDGKGSVTGAISCAPRESSPAVR
jgi:diguanylate cyclase (GGDEF)-like protein